MSVLERLSRCLRCGHQWEQHRDPTSEDLCMGIRDRGDGVCRCDRVRPPTSEELDEAIAYDEATLTEKELTE